MANPGGRIGRGAEVAGQRQLAIQQFTNRMAAICDKDMNFTMVESTRREEETVSDEVSRAEEDAAGRSAAGTGMGRESGWSTREDDDRGLERSVATWASMDMASAEHGAVAEGNTSGGMAERRRR